MQAERLWDRTLPVVKNDVAERLLDFKSALATVVLQENLDAERISQHGAPLARAAPHPFENAAHKKGLGPLPIPSAAIPRARGRPK
jgi:hypothetical protein